MYVIEYYSAIKRNGLDLKGIMLSEMRHRGRKTPYGFSYL